MSLSRVFSGIQPSGDVQLGNYLGAIKGWVDRQDEKDNFFCIVDLHALTVYQDPNNLNHQIKSLAAILFAAGLDPAKCSVFIQSHVKEHSELCWLLNCITPIGWLERMTQYKDKSSGQESVSTGLLDYPVLMASDILLYDAVEVPVGDDQKQHVELARDICQRFNNIYGDTFALPEPVIPNIGARVMGFDNPLIKMSKSYSHIRGHAIRIIDTEDEILRTVKRAVTDSGNEIKFSDNPDNAGVNNLLGIYKVITGESKKDVESNFINSRGYGDLKIKVAEVIIEELQPIRKRYRDLMENPDHLDKLLSDGAEKARSLAEKKMEIVKNKIGLVSR
ncbi:MAG: tryptophan--tRNA ligase [SAR202 cluster bacterium]|nr:tryptophan--tRNA ligase [SAR202 cluster bacterium]